jgi:hypothetical protein
MELPHMQDIIFASIVIESKKLHFSLSTTFFTRREVGVVDFREKNSGEYNCMNFTT